MGSVMGEEQELILAAMERQQTAWNAWAKALEEANNASAELARLLLIAEAEEEESDVAGLRFSTEYCYDDEGGYFESISVATVDSEGEDIDYHDELESCGAGAIRLLCGDGKGADHGQITVVEARERSF